MAYILARKEEPATSWANASDEQIAAMIAAADAGQIDLADIWHVGDTRTVSLSAMSAIGAETANPAQTASFVLVDADNSNYEYVTSLSSGETHCRFVVGLAEQLEYGGYMHIPASNNPGWGSCQRRTWCNETFRNAIPSTLREIFKQVKVKSVNNYQTPTVTTSNDYFFMPAEREVLSTRFKSPQNEWNVLSQFEYYETTANRNKGEHYISPDSPYPQYKYYWWTRSLIDYAQNNFVIIKGDGNGENATSDLNWGLVPHGCI